MTEQIKKKAKRKLSEISFDHTGAHLALCSKSQGAANGYNHALIMKSSKNFSEEFIEKMQSVKVELSIPDFLEKFFHIYGEDADVLAQLMGYDPEGRDPDASEDEAEDAMNSAETYEEYKMLRKKYIEEKVKLFEVMKSLKDSASIADEISKLSETEYLDLVTEQSVIEKKLKEAEEIIKTKSTPVKKNKKSKEIPMEDEDKKVEVIEKAAFEAVKAEQEKTKVALEKALSTIAAFEAEKKESVRKSRLSALEVAVKDKEKAAVVFKALGLVEDAALFDEVVEVLGTLVSATDKSEMFIEKGADAGEKKPADKADILKERLKKKYHNK